MIGTQREYCQRRGQMDKRKKIEQSRHWEECNGTVCTAKNTFSPFLQKAVENTRFVCGLKMRHAAWKKAKHQNNS